MQQTERYLTFALGKGRLAKNALEIGRASCRERV